MNHLRVLEVLSKIRNKDAKDVQLERDNIFAEIQTEQLTKRPSVMTVLRYMNRTYLWRLFILLMVLFFGRFCGIK